MLFLNVFNAAPLQSYNDYSVETRVVTSDMQKILLCFFLGM